MGIKHMEKREIKKSDQDLDQKKHTKKHNKNKNPTLDHYTLSISSVNDLILLLPFHLCSSSLSLTAFSLASGTVPHN